MVPRTRIAELELELIATRNAAVQLVTGLVRGLVATEEGRHDIAEALLEAAEESRDPEEARIARLVAAALRP